MRLGTLAALAALLLAASNARAQDVGQLNWRVTDLERRVTLAENSNQTLAVELQNAANRIAALEQKFGQLVGILDTQMKANARQLRQLQDETALLRKASEEAVAKSLATSKTEPVPAKTK